MGRAPDGALLGGRGATRYREISRYEALTQLDRTHPLPVEINIVDVLQRLYQTYTYIVTLTTVTDRI